MWENLVTFRVLISLNRVFGFTLSVPRCLINDKYPGGVLRARISSFLLFTLLKMKIGSWEGGADR